MQLYTQWFQPIFDWMMTLDYFIQTINSAPLICGDFPGYAYLDLLTMKLQGIGYKCHQNIVKEEIVLFKATRCVKIPRVKRCRNHQ